MTEIATIAPADILGALDGEQPISALFASYTFSPGIFAAEYVRPLLRRGCGRIVAIVDRLGWAQSLAEAPTVDGPGTNYYLRCAELSDSFHPKLTILRTATRAVVSVGSGNLTAAGLGLNAETGLVAVVDDNTALRALDDIASRVERIGGFEGSAVQSLVPVDLGEGTLLLTSLDRALLPSDHVPRDAQRIEIVSPFLDDDLGALAWMRRSWPAASIRLRTDPRCTRVDERLLGLSRAGVRVEVPDEDEGERTPIVHGKLIAWYSGPRVHVWLGSPNLSRRALVDRRNVEMVAAITVTIEEADALLHVPEVKWRRLRDSDAERVYAVPAHPPSCSELIAELVRDTLRIRLPRPERATCSLRLLRGSKSIHRAEVLLDATGRLASLALDSAALGALEGALVVELESASGRLYRGWLEHRAQLDAPPELRAHLGFLSDLAADPATCHEDETVRFLQWISAQLGQVASGWKWGSSSTGGVRREGADEATISRERFLEAEREPGSAGFSATIDVTVGALDRAIHALRFFTPETPASLTAVPERDGAPSPNIAGSPPGDSGAAAAASASEKIRRAVEKAIARYAEALGRATDVHAAARLLLALPVVVRTMAMCRRRWGLPAWAARIHAVEVVTATLGPGRSSLVGMAGLVTRQSTADLSLLAKDRSVCRAIGTAASLLVMLGGRSDGIRADVARDMLDVLDRLGATERSPEVADLAIGDGRGSESPLFDPIAAEHSLRSVPGEIGVIVELRRHLRNLVTRAAAGAGRVELERLATAAGLHVGCRDEVLGMLCRLAAARRPVRLVDTWSEATPCPDCGCTLPRGKAARLADATYVAIDECGVLFAKSVAP